MSFCEDKGKDKVIFLTEEDSKKSESNVVLTEDPDGDDKPTGLIREDGSINWNCPCLGGMAIGPCGIEFRQAFECFHYRYVRSLKRVLVMCISLLFSEADPKGSDCMEKFAEMQDCMQRYPELYDNDDSEESAVKMPDSNPDDNEAKQEDSKSVTEKS